MHSIRIRIPLSFYLIALTAFGIQHIMYGDFIAGRAPAWPIDVSGKLVFAYVTGVVLIVPGLFSSLNKGARLALVISGLMILTWAALRNLYTIAVHPEYGALLTNVFKSVSIGFGAFIAAETFVHNPGGRLEHVIKVGSQIGMYMIAAFLIVGGVQHFLFAGFVRYLVPTWIPADIFWTYFAGIALIASGLGIAMNIKRSLASFLAGGMVFVWVIVLHLPRALNINNQNEWIAVFEALAFSGLLFLIGERSQEMNGFHPIKDS